MAAPSQQDLRDQGRTVLIVRRPDLSVDEGDVSAMLLDEGVAMADLSLGVHARDVVATYLAGARGSKLTELAADHFQVQRDPASPAKGSVTFSRTPGGAGTIPAGTRIATEPAADGSFQEATTDIDLVFAAEDELSVPATASVAGRAGNVAAGGFVRILDTLFDTFTVTNPATFAGGNPEQDDESLIQEVRDRERTKQRGTIEAVEYAARLVPGVYTATAQVVDGLPTLFVADSDGNSNAEMVAAVEAVLPEWEAFGVSVVVVGGILYLQAIAIVLTVRAGVDVAALALRVRQAVVSAVNRLRIGETLDRGLIEAAVRSVDRDAITGVAIQTPGANIQPATGEVIRTNLSLASVT